MRKYQIASTGFGEYDLVERKLKTKQMAKQDMKARNRELSSYSKTARHQASCRLCIYGESQRPGSLLDRAKVGESTHWLVFYPCLLGVGVSRPLAPAGCQGQPDEPMTHLHLVPKEHCSCSLELEEEISRDLQSLKKALARFWATTEVANAGQ